MHNHDRRAAVREEVSEIVSDIHTMGMSDQLIGIKEHYYTRQLNQRTDALLEIIDAECLAVLDSLAQANEYGMYIDPSLTSGELVEVHRSHVRAAIEEVRAGIAGKDTEAKS